MSCNLIGYNELKENVKGIAKNYSFKKQFITYMDNCGFETNNNNNNITSIELTNEIRILINNNNNNIKTILNQIPKFAYFCDIGDIYNLWKLIYIKCAEPIIIIGAGVSGLTIASNIQHNPVLILEARDRIGGRIYTNEHNMDMGAAWLHGSDNNPLNVFLDYDNLIPVSKCNPWMHSENTPITYLSTKCNITEDKRQTMATKWNELAVKISNIQDKTIIEALQQINAEEKETECDIDLSSFLYMIEVWCGGSVNNLSTSFLNISHDETDYKGALFGDYGGSHYIFKNGAKSLIDAIINKSSSFSDKIKCNQVVTDIIYNDYFVEVHTSNGVIYNCNKLCITIPPGPLKDIQFNPPLDNVRLNALSKIKLGSYKKVQLEFLPNDVFWNDNVPMFLTCNPKSNGNDYYLHESKEDSCPYILWNNYKFSKNKPILEAICPANIGWNLAGRPDEVIVEMMMTQLRNYFPNVPEPKA